MNKKIKIEIAVGIIIIVAVLIGGSFIFSGYKNNKDTGAILEDHKNDGVVCRDGWKKYSQEAIGISFCYLEKWGKPYTEPSENITRLKGIVDNYGEDNGYYNSIYIGFTEANKLQLRIFNEQYPGEHYPNSRTYHLGYMDNIPKLKEAGNVCDYKIEFDKKWEENDKKKEIYTKCSDGVKEFITETEQYFSGFKYSYDLKLANYKKLSNGFFDNLLAIYSVGNLTQIDGRLSGIDDLLSRTETGLSMGEYASMRDDFKIFVDSINSFEPKKKKIKDCSIIDEEDKNITLIRRYYCHLSNEKLEEAFSMRNDKSSQYEEFSGWYANINEAVPRDFVKKQDGSYEFYVDYQDYNSAPEIYKVVMRVDNGRLKTIFSEKYISNIANSNNGNIAYGAKRGSENLMILEIDGKEFVLDRGDAEYDGNGSNIRTVKYFSDPKFSETGKYLLYSMFGWEWSETRLYDLEKRKEMILFNSPSDIGFVNNDKFLFVCSSGGMASAPGGKVYSLPDLKVLFDLVGNNDNPEFIDVDCRYDEVTHDFIFKTSDYYQGDLADKKKIVEKIYHLE